MTRSSEATRTTARSPGQVIAMVVGVVFLLVGLAGFVPGLTTDYDQLTFAGHNSMAMLLGLFMVSVLHNVVHLLFGIAGLVLARTSRGAHGYLIGGGVTWCCGSTAWSSTTTPPRTSSRSTPPTTGCTSASASA